jgi:TetR/AcrR family transcriptional regulator, cholesterol catabolism regulator
MSPRADSKQTREQILVVSEAHFIKNGFRGITMDELAAMIGISKKTLYVYFPDKHAILDEVMNHRFSRLFDILAKVREDNKGKGVECFIAVMSKWQEILSEMHPVFWNEIHLEAGDFLEKTAKLRCKLIHGIFEQMIRDGVAEGYCRPEIDPYLISDIMLASAEGLVRSSKSVELGKSPQELIVTLVRTMMFGILTNEGRNNLRTAKASRVANHKHS